MIYNVFSTSNVDDIHPAVRALNFDKLKWKLCESSEAKMSKEQCELAEQEYRKFLSLKKYYPDAALVPNQLLDEFWHAHILDTAAYHADCDMVFGKYIHHYPYFGIDGAEDYQNLVEGFEETKALYAMHFGPYPDQLDSNARCEDHACHAPSNCACRSPGACK
jgi:hypothetical protein